MTRMSPVFILLLGFILFSAEPVCAQTSEKALAVLVDSAKARAERRAALSSLLESPQSEDFAAVLDRLWKAEVFLSLLDPAQAKQAKSLEGRLLSKPGFTRFLAAAFRHESALVRQRAVAWSRNSTWPWLLRRRLRAFESEKHEETRGHFLDAIQGSLKSDEMSTVLRHRRGQEAEKGALFRLGLARAPRSQRVQAWPGGKDWIKRGFSGSGEAAPYRLIVATEAQIPAPLARRAKSLLIAVRRRSAKKRGLMKVRVGDEEVGEFALGTSARLEEIVEVVFKKTRSLLDQEVVLTLDESLKGQVEFRAVVALEAAQPADFFVAQEVLFDDKVLAASHGVEKGPARTGGLRIKGGEAHIAVNIPAYEGRARRIDIDHWSPASKPGIWDVTLNGQPLVRLISQRLPRAAKCFPRLMNLGPGRHELIFTRVSGGELYLEAIRFVR